VPRQLAVKPGFITFNRRQSELLCSGSTRTLIVSLQDVPSTKKNYGDDFGAMKGV